MAVKLRLVRVGKTKAPTYRIVAADGRAPRNGRFLEILGTYDPLQDPPRLELKNEAAQKWLSNGAQPTETVAKLLKVAGATQ